MEIEISDKHQSIYSTKSNRIKKEGHSIEVILHFPKSQKMENELAKRVATIHAQAILTSVAQLDCPTDQKITLVEAVQKLVREDMSKENGT